jgi:hypothetical protein
MNNSNTPIKFDFYSGHTVTRTEILIGPLIKVGKLSSSQLKIDDESVSRMHASIEIKSPNEVVLLDLGSIEGTEVNGEKITRTVLHTGDSIQFGRVRVVVTIAGQQPRVSQETKQKVQVHLPNLDEYVNAVNSKVLEVLALYNTHVIDVDHVKESGEYTIGFTQGVNCFINKEFIPCDPFPLAYVESDDRMMVNIPDSAQGEVMLDGKIFNLNELRSANKLGASPVPGCKTLQLFFKARCRLVLGDFTFLLNAVPDVKTPQQLKWQDRVDPSLIFSILSVGTFCASILLLLSLIPPTPASLNLDLLNLDSRFIDILQDVEEEIEEKKDKSGGDAGKKAQDESGKMGKKEELDKMLKSQMKGTDEGDPEAIRAAKRQLAENVANDILGALDSGLLSGDTNAIALGSLERFTGNINGATAGNSFGAGGLGAVGTGGGGGGTGTGFGFGGFGTVGTGGGGKGIGGGYGGGRSNLGKRRARRPKLKALPPSVSGGGLTKKQVKRVILSRKRAYQNCYERQLQIKKDLTGTIKIKLLINSRGKVARANAVQNTMKNQRVEGCVLKHIKILRFPKAKNGKSTLVTYPFRFK